MSSLSLCFLFIFCPHTIPGFYGRHPHTMLCYNRPWTTAETASRYSLSQCTGCGFYIDRGITAFHLQRCTSTTHSSNLASPADSLHRPNNEPGAHPLDLSVELPVGVQFRLSGNGESPDELQNDIVSLNGEEGDDSLGCQDDRSFQSIWFDTSAASIMDSSGTNPHSLLGCVFLAGWSQWTKLDDDTDLDLHVPFKVYDVEIEENGGETPLPCYTPLLGAPCSVASPPPPPPPTPPPPRPSRLL